MMVELANSFLDFWNKLFGSPVPADAYPTIDIGQYGHLIGGTPTAQRKAQAQMLLLGTGIGLAAIIGGEAVYGSLLRNKRRKGQKNALQTGVSTPADRGTAAVVAVLSNKTVMAPLSYLYVQAAEDAGLIPGAYGDAYQAVMSAMVGADLASAIGKVVPF